MNDSSVRQDLPSIARAIIESNAYVTLGTADETGRPWVTPVYFAVKGYTEFYWVSSPEATHSRNIAVRPQVGMVIFDSQAPILTGQAVYMAGRAEMVADSELEEGIGLFSQRLVGHDAGAWKLASVQTPEPYRLYRAVVAEHSVIDPDRRPEGRTPVKL